MLKQVLHQVLKQNPSKSQAKSNQSKGKGLKALLRLMHQSFRNVMGGLVDG